MELSIQERLKDLRVERGLTLELLEEQVNLSKSALGSYEAKDFKDISHYAIIKLAKFYGVTADYLLGLSQTRNHPNADLADLRLSDDMIELLKSGLIDNSLLCELAVHPDFPRLMADLEIYVNGIAGKQVQSANAIVDAVSATIMKQHNLGLSDPQLRQLMAVRIPSPSVGTARSSLPYGGQRGRMRPTVIWRGTGMTSASTTAATPPEGWTSSPPFTRV